MHINKVHAIRTLALVASELGKDVDWLADIAIDLEPEDGLIWVYDPEYPDGTMAFSEFGIESLCNLIDIHRSTPKLGRRGLRRMNTVQAQDRQVTAYSGSIGVEMPASMLRGSDPKAATASETSQARKVRVVLQSPYGN